MVGARIRTCNILVVLSIAAPATRAAAPVAPFTPGNILLTRNSIFSSGTDFLYEYTPTGTLVQTIPIGRPDGSNLTAGDVVYDSQGRIHLLQANSYVSTFDPATQLWTHTSAPVAISNGSDYDLSLFGDYVFQRQMRLNLNTHDVATINPSSPGTYSETSVGLDGLLYSLNTGSIRWDVQRTDPSSLLPVGPTIRLHDSNRGTLDARGIAATRDGQIFVAEWDGSLYKYDHDGLFLAKLITGANNLLSIDLRDDGTIMATSRFGDVIFTDVDFSKISKFNVGNDNSLGEEIYAGFVGSPVPEGSTVLQLLAGATLIGHAYRYRRGK